MLYWNIIKLNIKQKYISQKIFQSECLSFFSFNVPISTGCPAVPCEKPLNDEGKEACSTSGIV